RRHRTRRSFLLQRANVRDNGVDVLVGQLAFESRHELLFAVSYHVGDLTVTVVLLPVGISQVGLPLGLPVSFPRAILFMAKGALTPEQRCAISPRRDNAT